MANQQLSIGQIAQIAQQEGFSGQALIEAVTVALAESGGNTMPPDNVNEDGTRDRGLFQINSSHKDVSDACAYTAWCAAQAAFSISNNGTDFGAWTTYPGSPYYDPRSKYNTYLPQVQGVLGGQIPPPPSGSLTPLDLPGPLGPIGNAAGAAAGAIHGAAGAAAGAIGGAAGAGGGAIGGAVGSAESGIASGITSGIQLGVASFFNGLLSLKNAAVAEVENLGILVVGVVVVGVGLLLLNVPSKQTEEEAKTIAPAAEG